MDNFINENGYLVVNNLISKGITKYYIKKYIKENELECIGKGIYASRETLIDYAYLATLRCEKSVISHDEALYYYGLIDREPLAVTLTTYTGYNTKRLTSSHIKVYTVKKEFLDLGKTVVKDNYNNFIPMYDLERTMCDLFRNRSNFEIQDFQTALKSYVRRNDKDLNKLMEYAKKFQIDNIIRQYMEVLL